MPRCRSSGRDPRLGVLLALSACGHLVLPTAADEYRFATLFNLSKSVSAGAAGELVSLGESDAGAVESSSSPFVLIGQPQDPLDGRLHLAEWSNFVLTGREFVYRPGRQFEPQLIAVFAVEDANLTFSILGGDSVTREVAAGTVEHVAGAFYQKDVEIVSTGDVLLAGTSGGASFMPVPPVAATIFGQCSSSCRILILGGDDSILLTQSCTDGTVEQVTQGSWTNQPTEYLGRTCRWDAPAGHKIGGRVNLDGDGSEGTAFLAPAHFQLVTPLPASMDIVLLVSDRPAFCTYGSANCTLTGAVGVYHARVMGVAAGIVFECDEPVMAVGDADCPAHFDRSCALKEMNLIAAPIATLSSVSLTSSTTTNTTTSMTTTETVSSTTATSTGTSTSTATTTTSATTATTATATATATATSSISSTTTISVTTSVTTSATLSSTVTTTGTSTLSFTTTTTETLTPTTSASTVTTTPTMTTSETSSTLTSTATPADTSTTVTPTTSVTSVTRTPTTTCTASTATATTVSVTSTTASVTSVTHTTATVTTATVTSTTVSATSVTYTSTRTTTSSATTATGTPTSTTITSLTTTSITTALAASQEVTTVTTTTTTTPFIATMLVKQVEAQEASLFSAILDDNSTTRVDQRDGFTLVAVKIDAADIAAAGGNLTVVAEGTEAVASFTVRVPVPAACIPEAVTLPASLLTNLKADDGVVLVLTAFDLATADSMSTDDGATGTEPSVRVQAAVNINLFAFNGSRIAVASLIEPVRIVLPVNESTGLQCVFWDEARSQWATEGVLLISSTGDFVVCEIWHLTLFAAIARGFINTFACSQAALLNAAAIGALAESDWYWTLGAQMLAGFLAAFLLLLAVAACLDWRRWRQGMHRDVNFLIPMSAKTAMSNTCLEEPEPAGSWPCLWLCPVMCDWCHTSAALRDAMDDVVSNWASNFSEIRDFLEGFLDGLDLWDLCNGCCKAGFPMLLAHRLMSSTLSMSARRQAAVAVGISRDSSCFLMEDENITDVLLSHNAHRAHEGLLTSPQTNISATTLKREEEWNTLHSNVQTKLEAFMEASGRWSSVPRAIWRLFLEQNPFSASLVHCAFTSSKMRVLLLMVDLSGSMMLSTVFFTATGTPGKRNRSVDCVFSDPFELIGRLLAIGTASLVIAGIPSMFLGSLCTKGIKRFAYEGCPEWKRQLLVWRIQDGAIWVLGLVYVAGCMFFGLLFLANVAEKDQGSWLLSSLISVVEDTVIIPLAVALVLPVLGVACLSCISSLDKVKREDLISESSVEIKRQGNLTLPVERI